MKSYWLSINLFLFTCLAGCSSGTRNTPSSTIPADTTVKPTGTGVVSNSPEAGMIAPDSGKSDTGVTGNEKVNPEPKIMPYHNAPNQAAIDSAKKEMLKSKNRK